MSLGSGLAFLSRLCLFFYLRFLHSHAQKVGTSVRDGYNELLEREKHMRHLRQLRRRPALCLLFLLLLLLARLVVVRKVRGG